VPHQQSDPALHALARGIAVELRRFVGGAGRRRALPLTAYVGIPGVERWPLPCGPEHDAVLRADLVERAVDGLPEDAPQQARACGWVTRSGGLEPEPPDLDWLRAAHTGFDRHALVLPAFFVVNRYGWHEVLTGRSRHWYRVRASRART
jgi:hypothetical protein